MGTGTHTLIPTDHSGSCSHSPARPDPLPSALTEPGSPQTAHSSLQSRLRWPEQCPCPHLRTALNLLTYVWFMSSHTQCTCLRMWEAQEKLAGAGHLLQPGLCTRPAPGVTSSTSFLPSWSLASSPLFPPHCPCQRASSSQSQSTLFKGFAPLPRGQLPNTDALGTEEL